MVLFYINSWQEVLLFWAAAFPVQVMKAHCENDRALGEGS